MHLMSHQLYTFIELVSFEISLKKCQLLNLIDHLDDMLLVSKLHKTIRSTTREDQGHLRCSTHSDWYTREFMKPKESKLHSLIWYHSVLLHMFSQLVATPNKIHHLYCREKEKTMRSISLNNANIAIIIAQCIA